MSLALTKQLEITKDFEENKEIMMKEAVCMIVSNHTHKQTHYASP